MHNVEHVEVFHLFHEVTNQSIGPDSVMFLNVLSVCSHGGLVSIGERCFKAMKKYGLSPTLEHYNCVINLFACSGQLDEAIAMFQTMPFQQKKGGTLYIDMLCNVICKQWVYTLE